MKIFIKSSQEKIPRNMHSPDLEEAAAQACLQGCCASPFLSLSEHHHQQNTSKPRSTSSSTFRRGFAVTTTSAFFPDTKFTNHESLPSLQESFTLFIKAYPQYSETNRVDEIRAREYCHLSLSHKICLDYIGIGLFSHSQSQYSSTIPIASSSFPPPQRSYFPFFDISTKSVNLKSELLHGGQAFELESSIRRKIMDFLNISKNDYSMVFTVNRTAAFKLVAESYPFQSSQELVTVYDHKSQAVEAMIGISEKKGARVKSAEFIWPRLRIHSRNLRKTIARKRKKKNDNRGLFVFPLQSRVTGASYSYQWMSMAQENGWHVLLDACALGPKDMDSFGLSLMCPDFLICSFYKVFGGNPTGFACLFVKKSTISALEASTSTGIVSLVPAKKLLCLGEDSFGTGTELEQASRMGNQDSRSSSSAIECRCLDHVDSLGLILISSRARFLTNWLVNALMKLQHSNAEKRIPLVKIYGPRIKFDRGPALAFNVFDWKGEMVEPILVQKLADRRNISLSYGSLHRILFSDKCEGERERVMERRKTGGKEWLGSKRTTKGDHIRVVTVALGFLANFEDIYRLWTFLALFLDADFVERERWRCTTLNQEMF